MERSQSGEPAAELVRRAQRGDRAAFEDLVRMYYRQIHRWALGVTGDPDDADDIVQEVLVRLHKRLRSYAEKSKFTTWLYQVTRNTALEQTRKRTRRSRLLVGFRRTQPVKDTVEEKPLEQMQAAQVVDQIRTSFEALPPRQRQVFDLADLQGISPSEIGKMLDMNPVTVRANLCKARRTIRSTILARHPELVEELTK